MWDKMWDKGKQGLNGDKDFVMEKTAIRMTHWSSSILISYYATKILAMPRVIQVPCQK